MAKVIAGTGSEQAAAPPESLIDSRAGWPTVVSTFLATFTVFGVAYSFGAFFKPMADEFGSDRGQTALFFSITTFLYFAIGVITGRVADRIGPRRVLIVGAVCLVAGLLATSRVQSLWLGYLTYALGVGIGVACAYVPMVAAVGGWFNLKRTNALGLAVAGIGVGTLVMAPLAERLIEANGWRDTYVYMAIGAAVLLGLAAIGANKPPQAAAAAPPVPILELVKGNRAFWVLYLAMFLMTVVLFVPFVFMADYLKQEEVSGSAGWIVGTIGICSVLGRLGFGVIARRVSLMGLYQGSYLVVGLSFFLWILAGTSYPMLVLYAVVLGVSYGGFIALSPAVAAVVFGPVGLGGILGALYTGAGIGGLIGPPLMGALIDAIGYTPTLVIGAVVGVASAVVLLGLRGEPRPAAA
ncbi:MAG: MFS transporter [Acidimicrobiia bacterium]